MARPPQTQPAAISADRFAETYREEGWLSVEGRLAAEHAWIAPVQTNAHANVFVPVVPAGWKEGDAVHVIAVFDEPGGTEAASWFAAHENDVGPVTGSVAPRGVWDHQKMFPNLSIREPIVFIYVGQTPGGSHAKLIIGVILGCIWLAVVLPAVLRRKQARQIQAPTGQS